MKFVLQENYNIQLSLGADSGFAINWFTGNSHFFDKSEACFHCCNKLPSIWMYSYHPKRGIRSRKLDCKRKCFLHEQMTESGFNNNNYCCCASAIIADSWTGRSLCKSDILMALLWKKRTVKKKF